MNEQITPSVQGTAEPVAPAPAPVAAEPVAPVEPVTRQEDVRRRQAMAARRYECALTELYASWVHLSSLDHAMASTAVGGGDLRTFGTNIDDLRASLHAHPLVSEPHPVPLSTRTAEALVAVLNG